MSRVYAINRQRHALKYAAGHWMHFNYPAGCGLKSPLCSPEDVWMVVSFWFQPYLEDRLLYAPTKERAVRIMSTLLSHTTLSLTLNSLILKLVVYGRLYPSHQSDSGRLLSVVPAPGENPHHNERTTSCNPQGIWAFYTSLNTLERDSHLSNSLSGWWVGWPHR